MNDMYKYCQEQIVLMIKRSKTKIIFPIMTYGLIKDYNEINKITFTDNEIKKSYELSVAYFKKLLGHEMHIGGKYYDAYPSRNLPKYGVLSVVKNKVYQLTEPYLKNSKLLLNDIPNFVKEYIDSKIGDIPLFVDLTHRFEISKNIQVFNDLLNKQININPVNFEFFSFAILKVHLEKFACKIYRDTRTSAYDKGVDLSTNFGVIYQIKKLKIINEITARNVYDEIKNNFSKDRIYDGNVILIIDEISKDVKKYLINMKIQTISKSEILKLAEQLEIEDRMKVLKIVYDEFCREYKSDI